jgi:hypothetical protein
MPTVSQPIACPKCKAVLGVECFNRAELQPCPSCESPLRVDVFPALFREEKVVAAEGVMADGEASCFYHPEKKAAIVCDGCGRFLCSLCDVDFNGQHLCPTCLETGGQKGKITKLQSSRMLYNRQALILAVLPLFITGLAALYVAIRYWKTPSSLVSPQRWMMPTALALAILQTIAFSTIIILAIHG